jgi:hypothetical protein
MNLHNVLFTSVAMERVSFELDYPRDYCGCGNSRHKR